MTVWLWAADGPSSGGLGIAGDQGSAREAAEDRLRSGAATAAVVEAASAEIGIQTLTDGYHRTGEAWQAQLSDGRVTWAPGGPCPGDGRAMTVPKYIQAADVVRAQIEDGTLKPGRAAPSGAALAHLTGFSVLTCRKALGVLIDDGLLVPGPSRNARLRVAGGDPDTAGRLSAALAARRRAAGLGQAELATIAGYSLTTVGHAETGRLWQARKFWERVDIALDAGGELLRLYDTCRPCVN